MVDRFGYAAVLLSMFLASCAPGTVGTGSSGCSREGDPATVVPACTAYLASGTVPPADLASVRYYRAIAYERQGERDLALADFSASIESDPTGVQR